MCVRVTEHDTSDRFVQAYHVSDRSVVPIERVLIMGKDLMRVLDNVIFGIVTCEKNSFVEAV